MGRIQLTHCQFEPSKSMIFFIPHKYPRRLAWNREGNWGTWKWSVIVKFTQLIRGPARVKFKSNMQVTILFPNEKSFFLSTDIWATNQIAFLLIVSENVENIFALFAKKFIFKNFL